MPDHSHGYDDLSDLETLEKVKKGWNCEETPCGTGSTLRETEKVRAHLPRIASEYNIKTVVDAGAGDLHWMPLVNWDVEYQGFDLYPRHPDVKQADITKDLLPQADLILCRHVLNHLSIRQSEDALKRFFQSGCRYLLMTNCDLQRDYWGQYGLSIGSPIETFKDTTKWNLELYANPLR